MAEAGEFENWLAFADRDLQAATLLAASQHPLLEIVCFHCQQSAEKYLKAYLVRNTQEIKKTHDLRELCRACQVLDGEFNQLGTGLHRPDRLCRGDQVSVPPGA